MSFYNKGLFHWFIQRLSAIIFFFFLCLLFLNFFNNVFFGSLFFIILFFHVECGLETFIYDYMHNFFSIFISEILLDILTIFSLKSIFLLVIFL